MDEFQASIAIQHFNTLRTAKAQEVYLREVYEQFVPPKWGTTSIPATNFFLEAFKTFDRNKLPTYILATIINAKVYHEQTTPLRNPLW